MHVVFPEETTMQTTLYSEKSCIHPIFSSEVWHGADTMTDCSDGNERDRGFCLILWWIVFCVCGFFCVFLIFNFVFLFGALWLFLFSSGILPSLFPSHLVSWLHLKPGSMKMVQKIIWVRNRKKSFMVSFSGIEAA